MTSILQTYKGVDEHFIENNTTETALLLRISRNIDILDKIHYLEMQSGTIDDKIKQILDDYLKYFDIKPTNLQNGGLMTDWNFDIE